MSWINIKTEYSFKAVYGHLDGIAARCKDLGNKSAGIADFNNTFGHIPWKKACDKAGIKPIYGVRLPVFWDPFLKERRIPFNQMTFIAKSTEGLQEIYELVNIAHKQFYYTPRISYDQVNELSPEVAILSGVAPIWHLLKREGYKELGPNIPFSQRNNNPHNWPVVACIDNYYPCVEDIDVYEPFAENRLLERKTYPLHIWSTSEWLSHFPGRVGALEVLNELLDSCNADLPTAPMVRYIGDDCIEEWCKSGAKKRGIDIINEGVYKERYEREIALIKTKEYSDYFLVVADLIRYAKRKMVVGPSRGSSAGSLVCYLMGITELDPLEYDLYFERFIDVNRYDLPDIDIDFQDDKRHLCLKYLEKKYGRENVAQIGNINRMKAKSAISRFADSLNIAIGEVEELKDAIMDRSGGDARARFCIEDTINDTDVGKRFIEKYPQMRVVGKIESHASHCVSGEGRVCTDKGEILKISSLWDIYHGEPNLIHSHRVKKFGSKIKIRSYNFAKDELFIDEIKDVLFMGEKETFVIETSGSKLRATKDHLILTKGNTWKKVEDLKIGDLIAKNGKFKKGEDPWNKDLKGAQTAWNKGIPNPKKSKEMKENNPVHKPGVTRKIALKNTKHGRNSKHTLNYIKENIICEKCFNAESEICHHIDHNPYNNPEDGSNFQAVCRSCHSKIHNSGKYFNGTIPTGLTIGWHKVKEIKRYGIEKVYDLKMKSKYHNFVVNKVVVHNCGVHAAGILVCNDPITKYAGVNCRDNKRIAMLDKKDAEAVNLLKIDALGLRTLSILANVCDQIGKPYSWLYEIPLDDTNAYAVFNDQRYNGLFQFEGPAIKGLAKNMPVEDIDDISALGALGRPGPLNSGNANRFIKFRTGKEKFRYLSDHPAIIKATKKTFGSIIYQEQVMTIGREYGNLSWKDLDTLRRAMSKSYGDEFFDKYKNKFISGAIENSQTEEESLKVWEGIQTMGCLSGDTVLINPFPNHATPKFITLKELYENSGYIRKRNPGWDIIKKQQLYCMVEDNKVKPRRLLDVIESGIKTTYEIELKTGEKIRATSNHKFFTPNGWVKLEDLTCDNSIAIMGKRRKGSDQIPFKGTGSGAHNEWHGGSKSLIKARKELQEKYSNCQICKIAPHEQMHHKDSDRYNNEPDNLIAVCRKCHKWLHRGKDGINTIPHLVGKDIIFSQIIYIGSPKEEMTYDISMPEPNHNFVANNIIVHNSYGFNKSHSVSYGLITYLCAYMKGNYPLEFTVACLNHARSDQSAVKILRDAVENDNVKYEYINFEKSEKDWVVKDGILYGGFKTIHGIGPAMASKIIKLRHIGEPLPAGIQSKLDKSISPFKHLYPGREVYGDYYTDPKSHNLNGRVTHIKDTQNDGEYTIIGCMIKKNLRDANEACFVTKRGGAYETGHTSWLNLTLEDDTESLMVKIKREDYERIGREIAETGKENKDWYMVYGKKINGWSIMFVQNIMKITREDE